VRHRTDLEVMEKRKFFFKMRFEPRTVHPVAFLAAPYFRNHSLFKVQNLNESVELLDLLST